MNLEKLLLLESLIIEANINKQLKKELVTIINDIYDSSQKPKQKVFGLPPKKSIY